MAIRYVSEADNVEMDVQVGPQEEISAVAEENKCDPGAEAACAAKNPVEKAKEDPNTVPVAGINKNGIKEFYVDAKDVETYADLTEQTMLEALNDIIACNEEGGMEASNTVIVMSEGTEGYIHNLEKHGAACVSFVNEADDITVDVQVGPQGEEITAKEDPQEANPVDAVKRQYDTVVVAKDDDKFFMDVEDVQKCADINCESVIETLNGIIACNEEYDICADNIVVLCNEGMLTDTVAAFDEAGVTYVFESANPKEKSRKAIIKKMGKVVKAFLIDNGCMKIDTSTFFIGGQNADFVKGKGNTILVGISSKAANRAAMAAAVNGGSYNPSATDETNSMNALEQATKTIKDNKEEFCNVVAEEFPGLTVTNVKVQEGRLGVMNVAVTVKEKDSDKE